MTISNNKIKELGWEQDVIDPKYSKHVSHFKIGEVIKMKYYKPSSEATFSITKQNGDVEELATIEELTLTRLKNATDVLELNHADLLVQIFKNEY